LFISCGTNENVSSTTSPYLYPAREQRRLSNGAKLVVELRQHLRMMACVQHEGIANVYTNATPTKM
jgi:hypothetical protein